MRLASRIEKAEAGLVHDYIRRDLQQLARETGEPLESLYRELERLNRKYLPYAVPQPDGLLDIEPMLRAAAEGERLDYDDLLRSVKEAVRKLRTGQGDPE